MKVLLTGLVVLATAASVLGPGLASGREATALAAADPAASGADEPVLENFLYDLFSDIVVLQQEGRYDEASAVLEQALAEHGDNESLARSIMDQLVHNHWRWRNGTAEEVATRALHRYPDLQAAEMWTPVEVQQLYDRLRTELFGSLTIKKPEGCQMYLDSLLVAETPFVEPYLRVGEYDLRVTKERRHDYREVIVVEPGGDHVYEEIPLPALKDTRWWLTRTGLTAALTGAVWAIASGSGSSSSEAEPLPGAPALPGGE